MFWRKNVRLGVDAGRGHPLGCNEMAREPLSSRTGSIIRHRRLRRLTIAEG